MSDEITLKPKAYIGVTFDATGYFAVRMRWNADGFYEPWDTGFGRFTERADAAAEAKAWAEKDKLAYQDAPPSGAQVSRTKLDPKAAWPFPEKS